MRQFFAFILLLLTAGAGRAAETRLLVSVTNQFGFPVNTLRAEDFVVTVDKEVRPVQSAAQKTFPLVDVILLLDTSEVATQARGEIEHIAGVFIDRLGPKEQMAVVGYASSAEMVQDFTSSHQALRRAVSNLKYGNRPALLDSIYAVLDGGFEHAAGRRVLLVVGSGFDWRNRMERKEVLRLAQRNGVSIFAISFGGEGDLERLTEETAGAFYRGKQLKQIRQLAENVTAAFRSAYQVVVPGLDDASRVKVEVKTGDKLRVSYMLGTF